MVLVSVNKEIFAGVFFEMMTTEMRRLPVQSVGEMFNKNFTMMVVNTQSEFVPVQLILESQKRCQKNENFIEISLKI